MSQADNVKNSSPDLPDTVLKRWAVRVAKTFDARKPTQALKRLGIMLRASRAPCDASGKQIYGAWNPQLRCIQLFSCDEHRSDNQLVTALGHELWHVMTDTRQRVLGGRDAEALRGAHSTEAAARRFADAWRRQLGPAGVKACAAALRAQATTA